MLGSRESQWRKKKEKANDVLVVRKFTFYERSDKQGPCRQNKYRIWPTKHYKENTHIVILENNSNLVRKVRESISEDVTLELRIKESEGSWESHTKKLPSKQRNSNPDKGLRKWKDLSQEASCSTPEERSVLLEYCGQEGESRERRWKQAGDPTGSRGHGFGFHSKYNWEAIRRCYARIGLIWLRYNRHEFLSHGLRHGKIEFIS